MGRKKTLIFRQKSAMCCWPKQSFDEQSFSVEDFQSELRAYRDMKAKNVRTARKFLRSIGMEISSHGDLTGRTK